jgi:site-specific DNA-methyltransferase (adenine-specific)
LRTFSQTLNSQSVVAILTAPQDAAETWPHLVDLLQFQLWVAVKLNEPIQYSPLQLPQNHAALLILSKYKGSLRHTKTRIGYSFCPTCDKTTKDYGGKKHTYHEYGTLISDVWRDIQHDPTNLPIEVVTRIADLFGLDPYRELVVANLTSIRELLPMTKKLELSVSHIEPAARMESKLVQGDSLAELRKLPSNCVEFCFADPPYNIAKRYDSWDDAIDVKKYLNWCDCWLDELSRILRPGCTCAVLNIPLLAIHHFQHLKCNLTFQSWIAWEGLSLPVRMIMPAHYAPLYVFRRDARGACRGFPKAWCLLLKCTRLRR